MSKVLLSTCENHMQPILFRWFLCNTTIKPFVGSYYFHCTTNALFVCSYGFYSNTTFVLWFLCFSVKPMLSRWFLCFHSKSNAFSLVQRLFTIKPMRFRWFLWFVKSNAGFSLAPMVFKVKRMLSSLVPMLCTIKPLFVFLGSYWFLCFSYSNQWFFLSDSYVFLIA